MLNSYCNSQLADVRIIPISWEATALPNKEATSGVSCTDECLPSKLLKTVCLCVEHSDYCFGCSKTFCPAYSNSSLAKGLLKVSQSFKLTDRSK